jgi:tetratricopeptide (TPR) repeat protein
MQHMLGRTLGHYRISERIGAGGMGEVFRARDTHLNRDVAIKVLPAGSLADDSARRRFRNEALTLSRLSHPNIGTIFDFDTEDGVDFLVMEYLPGPTLAQRLEAGPLGESEVCELGGQIATAMAEAHEHGVIHRDLKPGNVIIAPKGIAKVLDFGLAKLLQPPVEDGVTATVTQTHAVGTLPYMAPEQLRGEPADARTDIHALGAVLYEMATGRRPFDAKLPTALAADIQTKQPEAPTAVNARLSAELSRIVLKCLEKDPRDRYQSATEIAVDLRRLRAAAVQAEAPARGWRKSLIPILGVGLLVLAVAVAALLVKRGGRPLLPGAGNRVSTGGAASRVAEANEYFEKAMLFLKSQMDLGRARPMLERALALDPGFAEARGWYGFLYVVTIDIGDSNDVGLLYRAEEEIRRALKDDPNSGRAHSALGTVYYYRGKMESARSEFELAHKLNPVELDADNWMISYFQLKGSNLAAQEEARKLISREPLFFPARMNLADLLRERGDKAEALRELDKIFETDPQNLFAFLSAARVYMDTSELDRARATLDRARPEDRRGYQFRGVMALLLALDRKPDDARREMDAEVLKYLALNPNQTLVAAEFYSVLGERDRAFEWLERAIRSGDERDEWFTRDPMLTGIRGDPRFKQVLESIAFRRQQTNR